MPNDRDSSQQQNVLTDSANSSPSAMINLNRLVDFFTFVFADGKLSEAGHFATGSTVACM